MKPKPKTSMKKRFFEKFVKSMPLGHWGEDYLWPEPQQSYFKFISQELKRERAELLTEIIILHQCTGKNCSLCRLAEKEGYFDD